MKNKFFTLAAVLTLTAVIGGFYAAPALAAVVKAALVQNVDEPGRQPYVFRFRGANNSFSTPAVPAGKRLVVQFVSVRYLSSGPNDLLVFINKLSGPSIDYPQFSYTMTASSTASNQVLSAPLIAYVDAGESLTLVSTALYGSQAENGVVTGYMIDCSAPSSCAPVAP